MPRKRFSILSAVPQSALLAGEIAGILVGVTLPSPLNVMTVLGASTVFTGLAIRKQQMENIPSTVASRYSRARTASGTRPRR